MQDVKSKAKEKPDEVVGIEETARQRIHADEASLAIDEFFPELQHPVFGPDEVRCIQGTTQRD